MYDVGMSRNDVDHRDDDPPPRSAPGTPPGSNGIAFLLSQVGALSAERFAERLRPLGLTPPHAGVLRLVASQPDLNQRRLAALLQSMPSRVVALVDELEARGLVVRERRRDDRRSHVLRLTDDGRKALVSLRRVATAHEAEVTDPLSPAELEQLRCLLTRLADGHALTPGVHPGYRTPTTGRRRS